MSKRTISKFSAFVILLGASAMVLVSCGHASLGRRERPRFDTEKSPYAEPRIVGRIAEPQVTESSGLAVSKCQENVFWTHNDSGDNAFVYAFDGSGKTLGIWRVTGAENRDWEDMASFRGMSGQCYLYIGEIGNNEGKRDRTIVYRVKEPLIESTAVTASRQAFKTEPAEELYVNYPSGRPDAETLLVHPRSGDIYIITKRLDGAASVYKIAQAFGSRQPVLAARVSDISVPSVPNGFLTGGDISPDGERLALCDYAAGYEYSLPSASASFDEIWKQPAVSFDVGDRQLGESIAYNADGTALYTTSEGSRPPIFEMKRR